MGEKRSGPAYGIVVAAGRSERMGGIDKVFAQLMGRPLLAWTMAAFKRCEDIEQVIVVAAPDQLPPQVFERELLVRAHEAAQSVATDDSALVESLGHPVTAYDGGRWNIKITTPDDLIVAEALLRARFANGQ